MGVCSELRFMINAILGSRGSFKKQDKTEQDRQAPCPPDMDILVWGSRL